MAYAPYIIFGALLLAGLNIPVSEDGMLFISALLAVSNPDRLYALFIAVFAGAYLSDLICYSLGRFVGPRIWRIKFFSSIASPAKIDKLNEYYHKYGAATLFCGRFIPFGVRNALFLSAGLGKMDFKKFAFLDFSACLLSCSVYFTLYYNYGSAVIEYVKQSNIVIFSVAILVVLIILYRKKLRKTGN